MMAGSLVVRREKRNRGVDKFWMDMRMVSARVLMVECPNLGEPKRHHQGANQEHHQLLAASGLSAHDDHA